MRMIDKFMRKERVQKRLHGWVDCPWIQQGSSQVFHHADIVHLRHSPQLPQWVQPQSRQTRGLNSGHIPTRPLHANDLRGAS